MGDNEIVDNSNKHTQKHTPINTQQNPSNIQQIPASTNREQINTKQSQTEELSVIDNLLNNIINNENENNTSELKAFDVSDIDTFINTPQNSSEQSQQEQTLDDIFGDYNVNSFYIKEDLDEQYRYLIYSAHKFLPTIVNDIEQYTKLKYDVAFSTDESLDVWALENIRVFSKNFFKNKGIFYCENIPEILNRFTYLRNTTMLSVQDGTFNDRYIYPICLPTGKVFTHMGYNVDSLMDKMGLLYKYEFTNFNNNLPPKYQIPLLQWVNQNNIVANLESLNMYDGHNVFCVEGYFDALRINDEFKCKSVALLGSKLSRNKLAILHAIKRQGHRLIYVPDNDTAGLSGVLKSPIWDEVYYIPSQLNPDFNIELNNNYKSNYTNPSIININGMNNKPTPNINNLEFSIENITKFSQEEMKIEEKDFGVCKDIDSYVRYSYLQLHGIEDNTFDVNTNYHDIKKMKLKFYEDSHGGEYFDKFRYR